MSKLITFEQLLPLKGIGYSRTSLRRKMKEKPPQFPRCVRMSGNRVAWREHEIDEYIKKLEHGNANPRPKSKKEKEDA